MDTDAGVALICGGLTNPGRAIAAELLRRGWSVVAQDRLADLEAQAARLAQEAHAGERLAAFGADLADEAQREDLLEFALEEFGRVDLLVGPPPIVPPPSDLLELAPADLERALAVGVLAPLFIAQRTASEMIRLIESETIEAGRIVFLGSLHADAAARAAAPLCLTSAAVASMTRLFAERLAEHDINVYELRLGLAAAPEAREKHAAAPDDALAPLRRPAHPRDVALAVAAIAADALPFTTGATIEIDGGMHLKRL